MLGWVKSTGDGQVIIMDVVSDGYKYYMEPDGVVRGKIVTPSGEIITYE